jgi:hypothetical protein
METDESYRAARLLAIVQTQKPQKKKARRFRRASFKRDKLPY